MIKYLDKCFYFLFFLTILAGSITSYINHFKYLPWLIVILSLAFSFGWLARVAIERNPLHGEMNIITLLLCIPFIYSIVISLANDITFKNLIIGLKNNFQFLPFFICLAYSYFFNNENTLIKRLFILLALMQVPLSLFQYFYIVPKLEAERLYWDINSSLLDAVSGSFGTSLKGGGTGVLAFFLIITLISTGIFYTEKYLSKKKFIGLCTLLLIPILLSETKVSAVFLFVGGSTLLILDKRINFYRKVNYLFVITVLTGGIVTLTIVNMLSYGDSFDDIIEKTISYNFGSTGYGVYALNRLTALTFWFSENIDSPLRMFFGYGIEVTNEGENGLSRSGIIAHKYPMFGTGLTTFSRTLWEGGIMGLLFFMLPYLVGFVKIKKLINSKFLSVADSSIARVTLVSIVLQVIVFLYNDSFRTIQAANFLAYMSLVFVVILEKNQRTLISGDLK